MKDTTGTKGKKMDNSVTNGGNTIFYMDSEACKRYETMFRTPNSPWGTLYAKAADKSLPTNEFVLPSPQNWLNLFLAKSSEEEVYILWFLLQRLLAEKKDPVSRNIIGAYFHYLIGEPYKAELAAIAPAGNAVAQKILLELLDTPDRDLAWNSHAFAYRSKCSRKDAVLSLDTAVAKGFRTALIVKIDDLAGNISHDLLKDQVAVYVRNRELEELIHYQLSIKPGGRGIAANAPLLNWVTKLYLDGLDRKLETATASFSRYKDEILVLCHDNDEAQCLATHITGLLRTNTGLNASHSIVPLEQVNFAGYGRRDDLWYDLESGETLTPPASLTAHISQESVQRVITDSDLQNIQNAMSGTVALTEEQKAWIATLAQELPRLDRIGRKERVSAAARRWGLATEQAFLMIAKAYEQAGLQKPPTLFDEVVLATDYTRGQGGKREGAAHEKFAPSISSILDCKQRVETPSCISAKIEEGLVQPIGESKPTRLDGQRHDFLNWIFNCDQDCERRFVGPQTYKRRRTSFYAKEDVQSLEGNRVIKNLGTGQAFCSLNAISDADVPNGGKNSDGKGLLTRNCTGIRFNVLSLELPDDDALTNALLQHLQTESPNGVALDPLLVQYAPDDLQDYEKWFLNYGLNVIAFLITQKGWSNLKVVYDGRASLQVIYRVSGIANLPVADCAESFNKYTNLWSRPICGGPVDPDALQCICMPGGEADRDRHLGVQALIWERDGNVMCADQVWEDLWGLGGGIGLPKLNWRRCCNIPSRDYENFEQCALDFIKNTISCMGWLDNPSAAVGQHFVDYMAGELLKKKYAMGLLSQEERNLEYVRGVIGKLIEQLTVERGLDAGNVRIDLKVDPQYDLSKYFSAREEWSRILDRDMTDKRFDWVFQVFDQAVYAKENEAIKGRVLCLPCGAGKTLCAYVVLSVLAADKSVSDGHPLVFVAETIDSAARAAENFRKAGLKAEAYTSRPKDCVKSDVDALQLSMNDYSACRDCQQVHCGCYNKHVLTWEKMLEQCQILTITHQCLRQIIGATYLSNQEHAGLAGMFASRMPRLKDLGLVVCDETPAMFTELELPLKKLHAVRQVLAEAGETALVRKLQEFVDTLRNESRSLGSSLVWHGKQLSEEWATQAALCLRNRFAKHEGRPGDYDTYEFVSEISGYLHKASRSAIWFEKATELRPELSPTSEDKIRLKTDVLQLTGCNEGNGLLVLDATSELIPAKWLDAVVYRVPECIVPYSDTEIHALPVAPTKHKMQQEQVRDYLSDEIASGFLKNHEKTSICVNKTGSEDLVRFISERLMRPVEEGGLGLTEEQIIVIYRGEHKGTNKARDCVNQIVAMSTFTDLVDIVLQATLITGKCKSRNALITTRKVKEADGTEILQHTARMNRLGQLDDQDCNRVAQREMAIDMIQALQRVCIRKDPTLTCRQIVVGLSCQQAQFIRRYLPGAVVCIKGEELYCYVVEEHMPVCDAAKKLGITAKAAYDRLKARYGIAPGT